VDRNFSAFMGMLPDLLLTHPGKYALLHDGEVVDFFDSLSDAVRFGHAKFGDLNFSVQEVTRQDVSLGFYSHALHPATPERSRTDA
jgi:hypothetical protein